MIKARKVHCEARNTLKRRRIEATQYKEAFKIAMNQTQAMSTRTRHKVTTCLYLSPNKRARSLSTLMAADVRADAAKNTSTKKIVYYGGDIFYVVNVTKICQNEENVEWLTKKTNAKISNCQTSK